jgi:hypothetical protein
MSRRVTRTFCQITIAYERNWGCRGLGARAEDFFFCALRIRYYIGLLAFGVIIYNHHLRTRRTELAAPMHPGDYEWSMIILNGLTIAVSPCRKQMLYASLYPCSDALRSRMVQYSERQATKLIKLDQGTEECTDLGRDRDNM